MRLFQHKMHMKLFVLETLWQNNEKKQKLNAVRALKPLAEFNEAL